MSEKNKLNTTRQLRALNIKLGGKCNLNCPHCHCSASHFQYNPKIIDWIKSRSYDNISFGGGEPLLYFATIRRIVEELGDNYNYRIVTNGTLLDSEKVDWLNKHNFKVLVSFDGFSGTRDQRVEPKWNEFREVKNAGLSVCCYPTNMGFHTIANDIETLKQKYDLTNLRTMGVLHHINFPHQTADAPNEAVTEDDVKQYVEQTQIQLLYFFSEYIDGAPLEGMFLLTRALKRWFIEKDYEGCVCCNDRSHSLTLDGRFMLCSYGHQFVGDVEHGIDFDLVNSLIPERCKGCDLWKICRNTCVANITENECKISKAMNQFLNETIDRLNIRQKIESDIKRLEKA